MIAWQPNTMPYCMAFYKTKIAIVYTHTQPWGPSNVWTSGKKYENFPKIVFVVIMVECLFLCPYRMEKGSSSGYFLSNHKDNSTSKIPFRSNFLEFWRILFDFYAIWKHWRSFLIRIINAPKTISLAKTVRIERMRYP